MDPRSSTCERGRARVRASLVILAIVALDQLSKAAARATLAPGRRHSFLGDLFRLELVQNPGAFLSLGATLPPRLRGLLLTWGVLALVLAAAWAAVVRPGARNVSLGAALVTGGGLGNLWDRIAANGYVTDFLNLGIGGLRTGVFNVADLAIVGGAALLLLPARPHPPRGAADHGESAPT